MNHIKKAILWIIASWVAIFIVTKYFPDYLNVWWGVVAFWISWLIFWILNTIVKPIIKLISLPFIIITVWLFMFVVNTIILYLLEYIFQAMPSLSVVFSVQWGFFSHLFVAVILSIVNYITHWIVDIK